MNWSEFYSIPMLSSHLTKLRYFQFKILHRIIGTNDFLFKIGFVVSNLCTFCNEECEDVPHLFWSCRVTLKFWRDVQSTVFKKWVNLTLKDVIFGILNMENHVLNFVILHGKQYIFNAKTSKQHRDITALKKILINIHLKKISP